MQSHSPGDGSKPHGAAQAPTESGWMDRQHMRQCFERRCVCRAVSLRSYRTGFTACSQLQQSCSTRTTAEALQTADQHRVIFASLMRLPTANKHDKSMAPTHEHPEICTKDFPTQDDHDMQTDLVDQLIGIRSNATSGFQREV